MSISEDGLENFNKLAAAIEGLDVKTCKALIERGTNLNFPYKNEGSLIHLALKNDQIEVAELLLEKGIDLGIKNKTGHNFMAYLAGASSFDYIPGSFTRLWKKLSSADALKCLQEYDNNGRTALHLSAYGYEGNIQVLKELVELTSVEGWLQLFNQKTRGSAPKTVFQTLVLSNHFTVLEKLFEKMDKDHKEDKLKLILEGGDESLLNLTASVASYDSESYLNMMLLLKQVPDTKTRKEFLLNPNDISKGIIYKLYINKDWPKLNEVLEVCGLPRITGLGYKTNEEILAILSKDEYFPELSKMQESKERFLERVKATSTQQLFTAGDAVALTQKFKDTISETRKDPLLLYGPLVKSQHTVDLEKIAKYILQDKKVTIDNSSGVCLVKVVLDDRTESYNLTQIMKFANLQHVVLNKEDMDRYVDFVKNRSQIKPKLGSSFGVPTEESFNNRDREGSLKDLSYSEKMALNIWTGPDNEPMWELLNGNFDAISKYEKHPSEILVHCVMAASGMNKVPDSLINYTYRWETAATPFTLERGAQRITEAGRGGILMERSFVSTSYKKPAESFYYTGKTNVGLFFSDGIIGKNISVISQFPLEREYLLPPVQVQFLEHIHETSKDGQEMDFFKCKTVRTPTSLPEEAQIAATHISEEELNRLKEELAIFQTSIVDLEAELRKKNYDPVFISLINKLNTETEMLLNRTDMDPFAKLKSIEEQLNVTMREVEGISLSLDDKVEEEKALNKILKEKRSGLRDKKIKYETNMLAKPAPPISFSSKEKESPKETPKLDDTEKPKRKT